MKRLRLVWLLFFLGVALVVAAMAWSNRTVWALERAQQHARALAEQEVNLRLALWRIDSALAPLLAVENARPAAGYLRSLATAPHSTAALAADGSPWGQIYFQFDAQGAVVESRVAARPEKSPTSDEARQRLVPLGQAVVRSDLARTLPSPLDVVPLASLVAREGQTQQTDAAEYQRRAQAVNQNLMVQTRQTSDLPVTVLPVRCGLLEPLWLEGELLLLRRVEHAGQPGFQGCLLDWPALQQSLRSEFEDLLPQARLEPVTRGDEAEGGRLAALPLRLVPGALPQEAEAAWGPATLSLLAAWAALALAAVAVAVLLVGVVRLSQRRATFVSAVTHELRTPLTTFQLYSEMLAAGMVPEAERPTYLRTLQEEAQRLTHLVENVLAYARLERGRTSAREEATAEVLLGPLLPRLAAVAARGSLELVVEIPPEALACRLWVNRSSLEQIVLNLVDNAAKYAAAAADKRLHLAASATDGFWELRVCDHGPGLTPARRRRWFSPFARSAHDAAGSAPGVGLGLALSRRLAQDMGGQLALDPAFHPGACFVLRLPCG